MVGVMSGDRGGDANKKQTQKHTLMTANLTALSNSESWVVAEFCLALRFILSPQLLFKIFFF